MSALDSVIDLFAGPGGWDEGRRKLLGEPRTTGAAHLTLADLPTSPVTVRGVLGFEWDHDACATASAAGHHRMEGDLSKIHPGLFRAKVLIGSPPCQGFSPAGKGVGRRDFEHLLVAISDIRQGEGVEIAIADLAAKIADEKSALVLEPVRWALMMPELPRVIALEQVKTVLPIWEAIADLFRDLGYSVWTGNVHAEEYGVPQTRTRAVLLASLDHDLSAGPTAPHLKYNPRTHRGPEGRARHLAEAQAAELKPCVTIAEALGWTDDTVVVSNYGTGGDPKARGERRGDEPAATVTSKTGRNKVIVAWPERDTAEDAAWVDTRPSPTIVGSFRPDIVAAPGYRKPGDGPRQNAVGSVRVTQVEAGVLQSFPLDYPWHGRSGSRYLQSGNAVPPLMASALLAFATTGK